jgi:diaminohydroxyphosphoribosylaminopyrimidine deaminase/5-amino-6-(5-phosphoribosylamino)uracil reductase
VISDPTPDDRRFMAEALGVAAHIPWRPWPNPPVGALVVQGSRVVGRGAHHGPGLPHAEAIALAQAGSLTRGATLYTTLEPCNHTGRTPPCAPRVVEAGIRRVVAAIADPNPHVAGGGFEVLLEAGIDVAIGALADAALDLIWPFAATRAFNRPFVLLKTATSLDGRFAAPNRPSDTPAAPIYLTGPEARRDVHRLRRWADLVLIGEGTLVADRPKLDGRLAAEDDGCPAADPMPAYADTDLSFAGDWPWKRFFVFTGPGLPDGNAGSRIEQAGGRILVCDAVGTRVSPQAILTTISGGLGKAVMVEAGPTLSAAFLRRGLVDRWICYTAPVVLGAGPTWPNQKEPVGLEGSRAYSLTRVERHGNDLKAVFDRPSFAGILRELTVERLERLRAREVA